MQNLVKKLPLLFLSSLLLFSSSIMGQVAKDAHFCAVPTPNGDFFSNLKQADGSFLKIKVNSRPPLDYLTTTDGYTVIKDKDDFLKYAQHNEKGNLIPTAMIAHNENERDETERDFVQKIDKHLQYKGEERANRLANYQLKMGGDGPELIFPPIGNQKALLLLIHFTDQVATYSVTDFNALANQTGYNVNGQSGSFRDYYQDISCGQLTINTDVQGWYVSNSVRSTYGYGNGFEATGGLIRQAVDAAEAAGLDFSQYDGDNDGNVDVVMVIHSGRGTEESGDNNDIWSHRWQLAATGNHVNYDGVWINDYMIQPEKLGSVNITNIGILCHEFGHALGLPDLYDIDYTSSGIGEWCLMAGGSWNNGGRTPAHMSAWCKQKVGWISPTLLENCGTSISNMGSTDNSCEEYYRINTPVSTEYFLLENRQKQGWDNAIPGSGLLIWHIDEAKIDASDNTNTVNADETHYGVALEQADGIANLNNGSNRGDAGDPFPGISNNTSFNNFTNPNSRNNNSNFSNVCIYNISVDGTAVSFDWEKEVDIQIDENTVTPLSLAAGATLNIATTLTNTAECMNVDASTLNYYLSADNVVDDTDNNLGSNAVGAINTGSSLNINGNVTIPDGTSDGTWFICTQSDANNAVEECDEDNNTNCVQIQIQANNDSCLAQAGRATSDNLNLCEAGNISNLTTQYPLGNAPSDDFTQAYALLNAANDEVLSITSTNFFNNLTAGSYCIRSFNILSTDIDNLDISNFPQPLADFRALNDSLCFDISTNCDISFTITTDTDEDGVCDDADNCPDTPNSNQADEDGDGVGDVCDACTGNDADGDSDGDGICDDTDNCPDTPNSNQADEDGDGVGDVCDACTGNDADGDSDGDGVCDDADNCPNTPNSDQADEDGDGIGDVCETATDPCDGLGGDSDEDGICDEEDNCPDTPNSDQADEDGNGVGDVCETVTDPCDGLGGDSDGDGVCDQIDNCPSTPNSNQADLDNDDVGNVCDICNGDDKSGDSDKDGICNDIDNCINTPNSNQSDIDNDGMGDACDVCTGNNSSGDSDGDGVCNDIDNCLNTPNSDQTDIDNDGIGDACENIDGCTLQAKLESIDTQIPIIKNLVIYHITINNGRSPYNYLPVHIDGYVKHSLKRAVIKIYATQTASFEFLITDADGCEVSVTHKAVADDIRITKYDIQAQSSIEQKDGSIEISVSGVDDNYTYEWSGISCPCPNTAQINGLETGWYSVKVTDSVNSNPAYGWYWVPRDKGGRGKLNGEGEKLFATPNPVRHQANIYFELTHDAVAYLDLYDISGQHIKDVINIRAKGETQYTAHLSVADLQTGIYLLRLQTNTGHTTYQKIVVTK